MELDDVVRALRARWWMPAAGLVLGALTALGLSMLAQPQYTTSMQLFVTTTDADSTSDAYQGSQLSQGRVASYARLLTGEALARQVVEDLGLSVTPRELTEQVTATAAADTVLIDVTVTDTSPEQAQRIAQELVEDFTTLVGVLETESDGASPIRVALTQTPDVPGEPSAPMVKRNVALGGVVGLLLGAGAALARARLDRSVKEPEEAGDLAGAPVIGTVLQDDVLRTRHVVDPGQPSRTLENYRQLRAQLRFLDVDQPPRVIMISSAMPEEGRTTAVLNLGLALAETGRQVTVVEADLRGPSIARYLGAVPGVGLTDVLAGSADLADVMRVHGDPGMSYVPAGAVPANPSRLLASDRMSDLMARLRDKNDFVLVDAPAILPVSDATELAAMVDGVLLSVRYGRSRKAHLQQAAEMLEHVGAPLLGLILNLVPTGAEFAGPLSARRLYASREQTPVARRRGRAGHAYRPELSYARPNRGVNPAGTQ